MVNIMKKIVSLIIFFSMLASTCIPVHAVSNSIAPKVDVSPKTVALAYQDMDVATEEEKIQIALAREKIIFSQVWVADEVDGWVYNADGSIKFEAPHFSELFPDDWAVPVFEKEENAVYSDTTVIDPIFSGEVWLTLASADYITPSFCTFYTTGFEGTPYEYRYERVDTWGLYQNTSVVASYNIGYTNADTGNSIGWAGDLENSEYFAINIPSYVKRVGVRASTNGNGPGTRESWFMRVYARRASDF